MPLCSRCTGLYAGLVLSLIILIILDRKIKADLPGRKIIIVLIILFCFVTIDSALTFFKAAPGNNIKQ